MEKFALLARVEAKPGKEQQVLDFLESALPLALDETETVRWYALKCSPHGECLRITCCCSYN